MAQKNNRFTFESPEQKEKYLNEVVAFFQDERDEEIGLIAAGQILEFFLEQVGPMVYRQAVLDCKKVLKEKTTDLEFELDTLAST